MEVDANKYRAPPKQVRQRRLSHSLLLNSPFFFLSFFFSFFFFLDFIVFLVLVLFSLSYFNFYIAQMDSFGSHI
jgi:hypothetical protein